jgi:NAD(P)-dependent dehydrogenase (short-subunit alcohol dehydrogenase family)
LTESTWYIVPHDTENPSRSGRFTGNIHVNVLSPGTIDTPILEGVPKDVLGGFIALIPRGTMGRPEEIATAALFLASSDSSFVTGIELFVSGGVAQI